MTVKLAKKINSKGRIYAVDVDQWNLDRLNRILEERHLTDRLK